jgi:hypothetical protein
MDLYCYLADHRTWICVPCGIGVKAGHYLAHLTKWHSDYTGVSSWKKARTLLVEVEELMLKAPIDPGSPEFRLP